MAKTSRDALRVLLLQIRHDEHVRQEEHESFARHSVLNKDQIDIWNVFDQPEIPADAANGYDALIIGGASEANVLEPETFSFIESSKRLIRQCITDDVPVFASCFGFQLAALALDGEVLHKEKDFEMGMVAISLTEQAASDPLMHDTPDQFLAVSVHQQFSRQAPPNTQTLAFTDTCCHAFRVPNKPFWAFQFHPELDRPTLIERLGRYQSHYINGGNQYDEVIASFKDTPESNKLLEKFISRVLLKG